MQIENLLITILLSLALAKILGELFRRIKQPALVGELLAGMILGSSLLAILEPDDSMRVLANVAVFFLIFMAGLELKFSDLKKSSKSAFLISVIGFTIPFVTGFYVSTFFGLGHIESLFVGLLLSITAIPVSSMILMEFGMLKSKIGTTVITAALINDIMAMIVFSLILLMPSDNQGTFDYSEIILVGFKILVFFSVLALTVFVMKKAKINSDRIEPFVAHLKTKEASLVILLALGLSIALFAHYFNLHFIIGAFFAGLIFGSNFWGEKIHQHNSKLISGITFGFFAPLFFVFIGLEFNLTSLSNSFPLLIALLSVAISSKIAGGFVASKITKFSNKESILIGCLMNGRGMVEMAIATLGYTMGLIDTALFSVVIAIGFLTTIITPVIAKPFVYRSKSDNSSVPHKPNDSNLNKNEEMIEGESKKTEYKIDIEERKIPDELKAVKSIDVGEIKKSNFFNLIEKIRQNLCIYKN